MQLRGDVRRAFARGRRRPLPAVGLVVLLAITCATGRAGADSFVATGGSIFREAGGPLNMTVLIPSVEAEVDAGEDLGVRASWTADVVSGASVAVVDAPASEVDAISAATLSDTRHVLGGGLSLRDGISTFSGNYRYSTESDYRSHAFDVSARAELYERNTVLEIAYARSFDEVCDGPAASEPVMKARLASSEGCFGDAEDRRARDLSTQTFQGTWTQNWLPTLSTQGTLTAQLLSGFQANPYRAVVIGRTAAQEHHPDDRARYSLGLETRLWLRPLSGTLATKLRAYRDTWDIRSLSAELSYEQSIGGGLRLRGRGRYYTQTEAAFFSDDYVLSPRGRYFTGDRELSDMSTVLLGAQLTYDAPPGDDGKVLGFLSGLQLSLKGDLLKSGFDFHYDQVEVPNDTALLGSASLRAGF